MICLLLNVLDFGDWNGKATHRDFFELPGSLKGEVASGLHILRF